MVSETNVMWVSIYNCVGPYLVYRMVSVRWLHGSRTLSELRYIVEGQFRYIKIHSWCHSRDRGLGNKTKKNVLFTAETFVLFPPLRLAVRYEFLDISKWLSLATHRHALLTQAWRDLFQLFSVKQCANACARANEKEKFLSMHLCLRLLHSLTEQSSLVCESFLLRCSDRSKHILCLQPRNMAAIQGHPMDLFLLTPVLQAVFCWLGYLEKIICPWKESESVTGK